MPYDDRLDDLLLRWEELYEQGQEVAPEELCRGFPNLVGPLEERIAALKRLVWLGQAESSSGSPERPCLDRQMIPQGTTLGGRYRLDELIGEGGFGWVWRAFDLDLERPVAVKLPRAARHYNGGGILTEARKAARLKHHRIVAVYDTGCHEGSHFFVSELIDGTDLAKRMRTSPPLAREAVRIIIEVAEALDYAHRQGVVHRDIKPSNILVDHAGQVYLTDFGIALASQDSGESGRVCGTAPYMAPEQRSGDPSATDARADIYALGITLRQLLTGSTTVAPPITADLRAGGSRREVSGWYSGETEMPRCLEEICDRCTAPERSDRYPSVRDVGEALRTAVAGLVGERDWLSCTDPLQMVSNLFNLDLFAAQRKIRLFACACVRQHWPLLTDERSRRAVEAAERCAEGHLDEDQLASARRAAWAVEGRSSVDPVQAAAWAIDRNPWTAAINASRHTSKESQCHFLHDIFGQSLFQPVTFDPSWLVKRGMAARQAAVEIYRNGAFGEIHRLADVLIETGCEDQVIIQHCRSEKPHVRGCWLVELLVGKEGAAIAGMAMEENPVNCYLPD